MMRRPPRSPLSPYTTLLRSTVGGASSIGGQKAIVVDTTNPTASVTTPAIDGNTYNATSLPGNPAGSSAHTPGSPSMPSGQVAIQAGAGDHPVGRHCNHASTS